ncbi:MAG: PTS lactose/cellobiose transporter subunit IIA [Eubacteriales bacterium]|nr:PTS lactose/cellobiose transporter subunit IIA [Eubacteriales bacterium]
MSEEMITACFQLITYVGTARSCYINAIQCAKEGKFDEAAESLKMGDEAFAQGHDGHSDLLAKEANGELSETGILLIHAEDQLMSAEGFRIIAEEFIAVYKTLSEGR